MQQATESPLRFPCSFPIKVVGAQHSTFEAEVMTIVRRHVADGDIEALQSRPSRHGKYLSVTVTIMASDRGQLDEIYRDLTACDAVLMAL